MDNPLTELPQGIRALQIGAEQEHLLQPSLSELRYLYACACNWTVIPEVVTTYSKLELLDLSDNLIEEYPIELGRLTSLTLLDLSDSALSEILNLSVNCLPWRSSILLKISSLRSRGWRI